MTNYTALAQEMLLALDKNRCQPPHEELSQTMRGEMAVLRLLAGEKRQLLAGEISKGLGMTTSRIAAVLNSLERKGMIIRCADPGDRRRVVVRLTPSGEDFCLARRRDAERDFAHLLERLGEEDARQFVHLLGRVFAILSEERGACRRQGGTL